MTWSVPVEGESELVEMIGLSAEGPVSVDVTQRPNSHHWKVLVKRGEWPMGVMLLSLADYTEGRCAEVMKRELGRLDPTYFSSSDIDYAI